MKTIIGPEKVVLRRGLQPFMFRLNTGGLIVQAQLESPADVTYPGYWATVVADDSGASWQPRQRPDIARGSPFFEGCAAHLNDGTNQ